MFDPRNALLAEYLDGEPASVAILHDYLMDQFEEPGKLHGNAARRMTVVLGLIRPDLSHHIACDFAEHVLDLFALGFPDDARLATALETKRQWLNGTATVEQLRAARKGVLDAISGIANRPRRLRLPLPVHFFAVSNRMLEHAARATFYASTQSDHAARDCYAAAIRAAEQAPAQLGRGQDKELAWQIAHLRRALSAAE